MADDGPIPIPVGLFSPAEKVHRSCQIIWDAPQLDGCVPDFRVRLSEPGSRDLWIDRMAGDGPIPIRWGLFSPAEKVHSRLPNNLGCTPIGWVCPGFSGKGCLNQDSRDLWIDRMADDGPIPIRWVSSPPAEKVHRCCQIIWDAPQIGWVCPGFSGKGCLNQDFRDLWNDRTPGGGLIPMQWFFCRLRGRKAIAASGDLN